MSFVMYMGMITGMLGGAIVAAIAMLIAKRRGVAPMVEEDERTELIRLRSGNLTCWALGGFSFVGWVTDNVLRHRSDLPVAFFSPWGLIFFATVVIYLLACLYESWKVSDNEAAPDDKEMKLMHQALAVLGVSLVLVGGVCIAAADRIDWPVMWFLLGLEFFLFALAGGLLVHGYRRRKSAHG